MLKEKRVFNLMKSYFKKLFSYDVIMIYKMNTSVPHATAATIRKVDKNNVNDAQNFQSKRYIDVFKSFLAVGDVGYYGYVNGKCVHRSWVQLGGGKVRFNRGCSRVLPADEIFIHYCETAPSARGMGIYPAVLTRIAEDFFDFKIYIAVNRKNSASIKGIEKVGFELVELSRALVIFGLPFARKYKYRQ
jgi:RimJ/RimL family protein N-acetyltransferase